MAKKNQTELVLEYMRVNGSITQKQAWDDLGISRLGARIWDLKHKEGIDVDDKMVDVPRRNGETAQVKKYWLPEGQLELSMEE